MNGTLPKGNPMNNPLLDEIKLAYQTQTLRPIRRLFSFSEKGMDYVCPLVALAVHRRVVDRADPGNVVDGGANTALDWADNTFGEDFAIGLMDAWDGRENARNNPQYQAGYALGVEAAQELNPRDPPH